MAVDLSGHRSSLLTLGETQTSVVVKRIVTVARNTTMRTISTKESTKANFPKISSQNSVFSLSANKTLGFSSRWRRHPISNGVIHAYSVIASLTYGQRILVHTIRMARAYASCSHSLPIEVKTLISKLVFEDKTFPLIDVSTCADEPAPISLASNNANVVTKKIGIHHIEHTVHDSHC